MDFAMQNPAINQQLSTNNSRCTLTICSELSFICGLGVGLGVINEKLPAGRGALATRRFTVNALLTVGGICSASTVGMIPCESMKSETSVRRLQLESRFGHTSGSVSEHKGDIGPVT